MVSLLSTFVTAAALLMLGQTTYATAAPASASSSLTANNNSTTGRSSLSVIWPRAVVAGSTTVMWIVDDDDDGPPGVVRNVSVRLATAERVFDEKTVTLEGLSAVELSIPKLKAFDGQLTVRLDWSNSSQEFPIHPLDPMQSLSLRLERSIYQPNQVVSIWISCLDHHGRLLMTDACPGVQVAIHDPNNIIVQYWNDAMASPNNHNGHHQQQQQQQPFKNLLFQLSNHPTAGGDKEAHQWTVRASVAGQDQLMVTCNFKVVDDLLLQQENVIQPMPTTPFLDSSVMMVESHFVELDFSSRTATTIHPGFPLAGELIAGTSEKGIVVGLDVKNHLGTTLHHQTLHLNRTSTAIFTVPALHNLLTTNATLQGTLMSIDGQPLDNQFVLASHQLFLEGEGAPSSYCRLQLFSHDGRYRFQEGDILHLAIYSSCKLRGNRIGYAVTSRSSGHVISWSQEMIVRAETSIDNDTLLPLNLSIPIVYEMIPGAIVTVFLVDERDSQQSHLASNSLDFQVDNRAECQVQLVEMQGNRARVNLTLGSSAHHHCLYGSWMQSLKASDSQQDLTASQTQQEQNAGQNVMTPVETDRFIHLLLPKYQQSPSQWQLFDTLDDLWFVQCYQPMSEPKWKEMELVVGRSRNKVHKSSPVLTLLSIDEEGRVRRSTSTKLPIKTAPWSVDFALPQSVRVAEELIVDVTLTNHFHANCSQTQLQMALTGGATFVANGKKYLQQPACLAPNTRSVYRVGIVVSDEQIPGLDITLTAQLRGGSEIELSCCAPLENSTVINLDHHRELVETLPVSRTVQVLAKDFENTHSDNYLFCLGESTFVSNASSFSYEMLPLAHQAKTIVFQASAPADLRVVLSVSSSPQELSGESAATYHLVLGGDDNMNSWVSKELNGLSEIKLKIPTPKILRQDRLQTFWISWDQHKLLGAKITAGNRKKRMSSKTSDRKRWQLSVGKGSHIGARTLISILLDATVDAADFRFVGFSTGFGFPGFFRVWGTAAGETVSETTRTLNIVKPNGAVTTQRAEIKIKGGIGASLDDVWSPIMSSSDSMTLTGLLENFHRERLASGGGKKLQAKNDWNRVLQNILSFRLADGSFHDGDRVSDLRLTALTAHVLSAIKSQSYSDPGLLESAFIWMHGRQNDDGSFSDFNQSDSRNRIVLTSFILTCLADVQHDNIVLYQLSSAAQRYLEIQLTNSLTNDVKIVVPMATAVLVSHSSSWPSALAKLDSVYDHLLDCYSNDSRDCLSEMAYCLTAYFHQNLPSRVLEMIKSLVTAPWQTLHPMEKVRAMKAWSKYGQVLNDPVRNLNVRLAFQDGEVTVVHSKHLNDSLLHNETVPLPMNDYNHVESNDTIQVQEEEEQHVRLHTPPLTYDVPNLPQNVELSIAGTGCAILQTKVHWTTSMPIEPSDSLLAVYSSVLADEGNDQNKDEPPSTLTAFICIQWKGTERTDLTLHLEMFSSYIVSSVAADDNLPEVKYRTRYNNASIDIYQVKSQCSRCIKIQAVRNGLVRDMQPGRIEVREKSLRMASQQWLLNAPDSHSSHWTKSSLTNGSTSQLKSRPATCS